MSQRNLDISMDYPSNSKAKQKKEETVERREVKKVVSTPAKTKTNGARKFVDMFIAEDMPTVKEHILNDVVIPNVKDLISEIIKDALDMFMWGSTSGSRKGRKSYISDSVSYSRFFDKHDRPSSTQDRRTGSYYYDDVIVGSKGEADDVLTRMDEIIESYGYVRIADLYELVGISSDNYMHNKYGWTSIRTAEIQRVRGGGYLIKMPKAMPIER